MSQRDRLAAMLHDLIEKVDLWCHSDDQEDVWQCRAEADALLARGVRVVDEETLARAIRSLYTDRNYLGHEAARDAAAILAALDAEPVKKRTRIYQSDVVVDEGDEEP